MEKVTRPRKPACPAKKPERTTLLSGPVQAADWDNSVMELSRSQAANSVVFVLRIGIPKSYKTRTFHGPHRESHARSMYGYLSARTPITALDLIRTGFK
jgi:hypothetical protein